MLLLLSKKRVNVVVGPIQQPQHQPIQQQPHETQMIPSNNIQNYDKKQTQHKKNNHVTFNLKPQILNVLDLEQYESQRKETVKDKEAPKHSRTAKTNCETLESLDVPGHHECLISEHQGVPELPNITNSKYPEVPDFLDNINPEHLEVLNLSDKVIFQIPKIPNLPDSSVHPQVPDLPDSSEHLQVLDLPVSSEHPQVPDLPDNIISEKQEALDLPDDAKSDTNSESSDDSHYMNFFTLDTIDDPLTRYIAENPYEDDLLLNNIDISDDDKDEENPNNEAGNEHTSTGSLPFLKVIFGFVNKKSTDTKALCDSGASHSIISQSAFDKIPDSKKYLIHQEERCVRVANKATLKTQGLALLPITFIDAKNLHHKVFWYFHISNEVAHEAYIGWDFLRSEHINSFNKKYLNLVEPQKKAKLVKIPLVNNVKQKNFNIYSAVFIDIAPQEAVWMETFASKPTTHSLLVIEPLQTQDDEQDIFEAISSIVETNDRDTYRIPIRNNTSNNTSI